jgi:hypothetical protein
MNLMQVDLVVNDSGVWTAAGRKIEPDVAYLVPGFWYKVSRQGPRLIAILANHSVGHEVCRLDITQEGTYQLAPYNHQPPSRPNGQLSDEHARIYAVISLLEQIQGSFVHCDIEQFASSRIRQAWPRHHRHVTDGKWQRVGKVPANATMTSTDATYIIFVAERQGQIERLKIWVSATCNIDVLLTALENL